MRYIITIVVTLAFCLPAHAEILVFKTSISGKQLDVASKVVENKKESGYFVIDLDLANPDSIVVNTAYHLHYETKTGRKIQYVTIPGNLEFVMVTAGKGKNMVLRYFDDTTGVYMVVCGSAKLKDIGGISRYVGNMSGSNVWIEPGYKTGSGAIKLSVDSKATKLANTAPGKTITQVIEEYSQSLTKKGYNPE